MAPNVPLRAGGFDPRYVVHNNTAASTGWNSQAGQPTPVEEPAYRIPSILSVSRTTGSHARGEIMDTPTGWSSQADQSPQHRIPSENGPEIGHSMDEVMTPDRHLSYLADRSTPVEEPTLPKTGSELCVLMADVITSSECWYSQLAGQPTQNRATISNGPEIGHSRGEIMAPDGRSYQEGQSMRFEEPPHRTPLPSVPVFGQAMGEVMPPDVGQDPVRKCLEKLRNTYQGKLRISFMSADGKFSSIKEAIDEGFKNLVGSDKLCTDKTAIAAKFALCIQVHDDDTEESHSFSKIYIYWRTGRAQPKPLTKAKLGCKISKKLQRSEELKAYCEQKGHNLGDLVLFDLVQKTRGSWQLNLFPKVAATALTSASTSV